MILLLDEYKTVYLHTCIYVWMLQMRPSFHPSSELLNAHGQETTNSITQSWQLSGKCPDNTIPIMRYQNARKTKKYVMKQNETVSQSSSDDDMKSLNPYTHEIPQTIGIFFCR